MIEGAIQVAELTVADVMVPRAQTVFLPIDVPQKDILNSSSIRALAFPSARRRKDEILGILLAKDLLRCLARARPCDIRALLRPVAMIPESKRLNILLKSSACRAATWRSSSTNTAGVAGLVTIEDVLEQIVGDIDDEHDIDEASKLIQPQPDGRFLVSALTPISDFNERFGTEFSDDAFDTVGGMVTSEMGHLPEAGEEAELGSFHFQVTKADARRVHQFAVRVGDA